MNKPVLTLFLSVCIVAGYAATNDYASKYAKDYIGTTDYTDYYKDYTCPKALSNANDAIGGLTEVVKDKNSTQWDVYAQAQKVQAVSYFLDNSCNTSNLEVSNQNKSKQKRDQAEACDQYITIVQTLLNQSASSSSYSSDSSSSSSSSYSSSSSSGSGSTTGGSYQQTLDLSQQTLELADDLADSCQIGIAEKESEEEEAEAKAENEEEVGEDESNGDEKLEDAVIEVTKESNGKNETYVIYYNPNHKGHADVVIKHNEEEEPTEEPPAKPRRKPEAKKEKKRHLRHKSSKNRPAKDTPPHF